MIQVIKTRVEATAAAGESLTMRTALKNMLHEGRLSSFYRGTVPTVLRDAPFSGIYAATFSFLKSKTENLRQDLGVIVGQTASSLTVKFGCGISAGALATLVTQPADVVRTRLQLVGLTSYPRWLLSNKFVLGWIRSTCGTFHQKHCFDNAA